MNVDVVTNSNINDITIIGVFELIAGLIAFLAILIAVSERIIKNYEEVQNMLDVQFRKVESGKLDINLHLLVYDIRKLNYRILQYNRFNTLSIIMGMFVLIGYGIWLLNTLPIIDILITIPIFGVALGPIVGMTLYCHFYVDHMRRKWIKYTY